ncbi:Npun_F5749 family FMN-dependent PPOX-type flavoprotein [Oscillatoria acuminata]|uniref:PPOX class probable FMN-dependent enzyme, alr4036 family n=1 Tax=Oscillatoria acuminata PCC 6304 TaxID=56110 RepID=K9TJE5_9CYAN|nr:Npun_F5749 family FMN-dependent PPOX-type flavoprotein [Oscillatoria acuminata]AFY82144.1 PPOX class probable FMN-dependent enzyme, alr4036 family [Oscillatoria acuminata PCC 6304]
MSLAPWRSPLNHALHRNRSRPESRYFQLATIRPDGTPANRTVVFRGFLEETNQLKIVTDARSQKAQQIPTHPHGEVCWYFPITREQFRLQGHLSLVDPQTPNPTLQQARCREWQQLSDSTRSQFSWPDPAAPCGDRDDFFPPIPDTSQPLAQFCLLLLDPITVDWLELRGEPQNRWLYQFNGDRTWSQQAINP